MMMLIATLTDIVWALVGLCGAAVVLLILCSIILFLVAFGPWAWRSKAVQDAIAAKRK